MSDVAEREALQVAVAGRYVIERELGRGGMGVVFLARDLALERLVAIKLLPRAVAQDAARRADFLREARTAAGLSHPNIVSIHLVEERNDLVYFVMSHIDGETLAQRVRHAGALPVPDALRVLQEVAWALAYAHGRGVIHRDVKPENIMLERLTGRAMVTDFGIAQRADGAGAPTGEITGTAHFMSPEQAQGDRVDARSDLYSLGVTAFFSLTGRLPFDAASLPALLARQVMQPAQPVAQLRAGLPPRFAAAVDRCLAKNAADRFATGEALAEEIGAIRSAIPDVPPIVRRLQRSFQLVPMLGTGLAVVLTWVALMAPAAVPTIATLLGAVWLLSVLDLLSHARLARRAGFTPQDVAAGFYADARARFDEDAAGSKLLTLLGRRDVIIVATLLGVAGLVLGIWLPVFGIRSPHWRVKLAFIGTFLLALIVPIALSAPARAATWGRLWEGALGRLWFAVGGIGVRGSASGR
jgi:serine/threonine-protein kinase